MTNALRRLAELCDSSPERTAVRLIEPRGRGVFRDATVSVSSWACGAAACASALTERGVTSGDRVLVALPTSEAFLHAFWGISSLGAIPVPLPSSTGWLRSTALQRRIANIVADASPRAAVADAGTARSMPGIEVVTPPFATSAMKLEVPDLDDSAPALIQYTSGSTGRPRGVVVTHANLRANVESAAHVTRIDADDRVLSWLPLYHDMGLVGGLIIPMWSGAAAHLMSPMHFLLSPPSWLHAISSYRATVTIAPNFAYNLLARKIREDELEGIDLSSLRLALNGAEPVDHETIERFTARFEKYGFPRTSFYPVYGLAESTLAAAFPPCGREPLIDRVERDSLAVGEPVVPSRSAGAAAFVSVGGALPGHAIVIRDPATGRDLPERHLGEIQLRGPSVTPYYFQSGEPHPDRRALLRTGDLGYVVGPELFVVDRMKDLIIIAGRSYVPSDLERIVETVPGVRTGRSVAFGVWDPELGTEQLIVVAEVKPALFLRTARIERQVSEVLEREVGLSPSEVVLARPQSIETTSSGKLIRASARETFTRSGFQKPYSLLHPLWIRSRLVRWWPRPLST